MLRSLFTRVRRPFAIGVLCVSIFSVAPHQTYAIGDGDDLRDASQQQRVERERTATPTPGAPGYQPVRLTPVVPELSIPIPGVQLTAPQIDGDDIVVPFLAQYISGVYRYLLGIATLVAIIVVIYGGFQYLLGQTIGSAQTGLTLIKDAVAGLVVLYASYLILWTVNPNLVNLQPIRLSRIQSVPIAEDSGADGDFSDTGSSDATQCTLHYNQGQSPWNALPYGDSPALLSSSTDERTLCSTQALTNGGTCFGTFQQSACGPTAVASVLAFYGLQVAIPTRVPTPGAQLHTVDPIDVGIFAIKQGYRQVGRGTTGEVATNADGGFPQFQERTISKTNTAEILRVLRAGTPLVFACRLVHLFSDDAATQPIASRRTGNTALYSPGHYMVLSGVVNDQILRVHDVGNTHTKTIRMEELQASCGSPVEIKPKTNAPEATTATWGSGATAVTVQMRLPPQSGSQCRGTTGAGTQAQASGDIFSFPFTYRPTGQTAVAWPENSARLLFPQRLRSGTTVPRVRVFIYLHGNNSGDLPPEERYIPYLRNALQGVAGTKDIVIMTPHHNQAGDRYPGFDLNDFYQTGLRSLQTVLPGVTVTDVVVGGHSGATCNGGPVLLQALNTPISGTRGVIAYDGCLGDVMTPTNTSGGAGISLYLNPDSGSGGMGAEDPSGVTGSERRNQIVRRLWSFGDTPKACPPCVASAGASATCYGQSTDFARPGGGELISFETNAGHGPSVEQMTKIAFCAFYR